MKQLIVIVILNFFCICSYAQFDNNIIQMFNQMIQYGDQALKDQKERYEQIMEESRRNMTVSTVILPSGKTDVYKALVTLSTPLGLEDLIIEYAPAEDVGDSYQLIEDFKRVSLSNCVVIQNYVWLPDILKPGYILRLRKIGASEALSLDYIPSKESSDYTAFKSTANNNLSILSSMYSGNSSSYPSFSYPNSSSGTGSGSSNHKTSACSMCGGTGEVVASTASYVGGTKWCSKCNKEVSEGHYHNTCPSCGGKGYR